MKRLISYIIFLIFVAKAVAQVNVTGTVIDKDANEPVAGASVIVKGTDGKIKKFASTKADGRFPCLCRLLTDAG